MTRAQLSLPGGVRKETCQIRDDVVRIGVGGNDKSASSETEDASKPTTLKISCTTAGASCIKIMYI